MEPLHDLRGRTLCASNAPLDIVLDGILRMNADAHNWRKPITVYVGTLHDNHDAPGALETMTICGVIQTLRSPVHTIGVGILTGYQALLLAAGERTHRFLLPHTVVCVGGEHVENLPLPHGNMGLAGHANGPSLRSQANDLICAELQHLSEKLGLNRELWHAPRVLSAQQAIVAGFADALVPNCTRKIELITHEINTIHGTEP